MNVLSKGRAQLPETIKVPPGFSILLTCVAALHQHVCQLCRFIAVQQKGIANVSVSVMLRTSGDDRNGRCLPLGRLMG